MTFQVTGDLERAEQCGGIPYGRTIVILSGRTNDRVIKLIEEKQIHAGKGESIESNATPRETLR